MNSCEKRECNFWNGKMCIDNIEYINSNNGELCCRYHPDAILKNNINCIDCGNWKGWECIDKCETCVDFSNHTKRNDRCD